MYRKASDPSFIDAGMEEELQARLSAGSRISIWWTRFRTTRRSGGFGRGHKRGLARALFAEALLQLEEQGNAVEGSGACGAGARDAENAAAGTGAFGTLG